MKTLSFVIALVLFLVLAGGGAILYFRIKQSGPSTPQAWRCVGREVAADTKIHLLADEHVCFNGLQVSIGQFAQHSRPATATHEAAGYRIDLSVRKDSDVFSANTDGLYEQGMPISYSVTGTDGKTSADVILHAAN